MRRPALGAVARVLALLVIAGAATAVVLVVRGMRVPGISEEEARSVIAGALQREAPQAFLVTGRLELTVQTRVRNTRRLRAGLLSIPLGSAESTVRAPGTVAYGIDVRQLRPEDVHVVGDTVELDLPDPRVYAVDALLDRMEVETDAGWLRLRGDAREEVQQQAIALVRTALEQQAEAHLADSEQPRINTAEAVAAVLERAFAALGRDPVFRFRITERLQLTT